MKKANQINLLSIVLLLTSFTTFAQEKQTFKTNFFNDVEFPANITVSGQALQTNGYGALSKNLSKIFSCALYVEHTTDDAISLIYSEDIKVIDLVMTSNNLQSEASIRRIKAAYAKDLKTAFDASEDEKQFVSALRKLDRINTSQVITVEKLFGEAFVKANNGNVEDINSDIEEYIASFSQLIKNGDHFRIISERNVVTLFKNGELLFQTNNKAFNKALMNIYLGNTSIDASLRSDLLSL